MRKLFTSSWTKLAATVAVLFFSVGASAQVATNYTFSQATGAYVPITGGTVIATATVGGTGAASLDDVVYTNNALPFAFTFNGVAYTTYNISTNGFITFGATAPTTGNYTPISNTGAYAGAVAGFGRDCQGNVTAGNLGEIRTQTLGSWPNRALVIQYSNFRRFGQTEDWDMQIILSETSHQVAVVYNTPTVGGSTTYPQVGLRGATNADFNNRTSTTDWSATTAGAVNNATITFTPAVSFPAGLTFIWTPINVCSGSPTAGTITGTASGCLGSSTTLSLSGSSFGPGITYQWQSSTVSGGPYTNMGNSTTQATGPLSGNMFFVCVITCTNGGLSSTTAEFAVTANPSPTISVSPTTSSLCMPGASAVAITASGSSVSYTWGPAAGLDVTTGPNVNALPATTTTYTVTGTGANGCTSTATTTVNIGITPGIGPVTATPPAVCSGGNSQLQATVYNNNALLNTYLFSTSTGATLDPMSGATTVVASNVDDTPSGVQTIGFNFPFNGQIYTQYAVSPDGWIRLGGGAATNEFTNVVTSTANIPKLYPYWDDCATGTNGSVQVLVTGTTPNRILKVQWFVTVPYNTGGAANSTFQAWLYETTGVIEYRYGAMGTPTSGSISGGATATAANYQSFTFTSNTSSVSVPNDVNAIAPANGRMYTLTPPSVTNYTWTPGTYLNNTAISNPMASGIMATTTYTVTGDIAGCTSSSGTVTITAGSPLTSSGSISPASTVCEGVTVTLNSTPVGGGAPYTYAWNGPNSFVSSVQNPTVVASPAAAGTYTLVITDNCAASSTVTLTLAVNTLPTVAVSPNISLYCSGSPAIALNASGTSTGYTWGPAAGLSSTTGASVNASPSATTTYTVIGTDANGCTNTATTTVNYGITPTATAVSTPTAVCAGGTATVSVTANTPVTYCQPTYTNGTGFGDYVSSVVVNTLNSPSGAAPSPYYTLFPAAGNTTTTLTAGSTYTITLVAGTYTINDVAAWIDYNQNGTLNNAGEKLGEFDNLGASPASASFVFTVPLTAMNGTTRLRVRDIDHATTNDMDPCASQSTFGETEDYIITIVGGVDAFSYAWSPATFLSSTVVAAPVASNVTATTSYTVVATNLDGCTASASTTLISNPLPTVTATITPATVCAGDMVTPAGSGATSYVWSGGLTDGVAFAAMTSDTYTVTGTDANGCTGTTTASVTVNALPTVTASLTPSTVCAGDMVTPAGSGATSYSWSGGLTDGVAFAAMTSDTYTVTGTDANGCTNTTTATVTVNALPTVVANLTPSTVCAGDMVLPTGSGATSYTWSGGLTDGVAFAATVSDTYTVTGTDANGCSSTGTGSVTVNALPTVTASLTPSTACVGDMVTPAGNGASTYVWTGGLTDNVAFAAMTSDTYTVTGTDANGCSNTTTVSITVNALPVVTASATDSSVCVGDQVTFMGGGASTYTWDNGVTDMVPYTVSGTMTYIVTGTDGNGCMDTASLVVNAAALPNVTVALPLDTACLLLGPVTLGGESPVGGTWSGSGVTGNTFDPGVAGNGMHAITYTYMDTLTGCSASAVDSMLVDICNDLGEIINSNAVIYPNPNNGDFTVIPSGSGLVDVYVYSATGQLVIAQKAVAGQPNAVKIETSGMYNVTVVTADGTRTTQRVVVNR